MIVQLKHILNFCVVLTLSTSYLPGVFGGRNARNNVRHNASRAVSSFPRTLAGFGYAFNGQGQLRKINKADGTITNQPFQFEISSDPKINQANYDALGNVITKHVYQLLQNMGLQRIYVPSQSRSSFVFATKTNFRNTKKLLIIIHGKGAIRAGQWARSIIINYSLDQGTQIPYIKRAIELGYDVLVTNTNNNWKTVNGQRVRLEGNGSPEEHINTVWNELIAPVIDSIGAFGVVGHSYGGVVTLEIAKNNPKAFIDKCFGVAFADSVHREGKLSGNIRNWFHVNARNYAKSARSLNTKLKYGSNDVPRYSAGHRVHKWTSWACMNALFPFMEQKYQQFLRNKKHDTTNNPKQALSSFPKTLARLGYAFNEQGQLRKINKADGTITNQPYQFEISSDPRTNQAHHDALCDAITEHIYQMMQNMGLRRIYVPSQSRSSFVFGTKTNFRNTRKLLIIIHGSGVVRAGQWARSLIFNNSLNHGTQIPYIKRAIELGYDVIVTNTNNNWKTVNGRRIPLEGNGSPEEHIETVWNELIAPVIDSIGSFGIIAHSYGGVVTVQMANNHPDTFLNKCFGVAFTDSVHRRGRLSGNIRSWFHANARNFAKSSRPLNTKLKYGSQDVPRYSAGHKDHKFTSWASINAVFPFMEQKYQQFSSRK